MKNSLTLIETKKIDQASSDEESYRGMIHSFMTDMSQSSKEVEKASL